MTPRIYFGPCRPVVCVLLDGELEPPLDPLELLLPGGAPAAVEFTRPSACRKWAVVKAFLRWPTRVCCVTSSEFFAPLADLFSEIRARHGLPLL